MLSQSASADLLDNPNPVVGVNDSITDVELTVSVTSHKGTACGDEQSLL